LPSTFRRLRRTDRDHHHLGCLAGLFQAQGFLDGDFIERIHRHLDIGEFNAGSVALDPDLDVVIDHPFHRHQNLHRPSFVLNLISLADWLWARNLKVPLSAVNAANPKNGRGWCWIEKSLCSDLFRADSLPG